MEVSKLGIYSLGIVAQNKPLSSKVIEVTPIEHASFLHGELTDAAATYSAKGTDASGASYNADILTTSTIKATWLSLGGSNRITAPDVRRGEMVAIYRFGDTDEFWWCTLKEDLSLRRLETVIYAFSATQVEGAKLDDTNTYFLEISTHTKSITLHTSKGNGEPYAYDIQINTGNGFIQIQDDDGNFIKFDSLDQIIQLVNKSGSKIEMNKVDINLESSGSINFKTQTITTNAAISNLTATIHTSTATATHNGMTIHNGVTNHNGDLNLAGNLGAGPGAGGGGNVTMSGNASVGGVLSANILNLPGDMSVGGAVNAGSVSSNGPMTAGSISTGDIKANNVTASGAVSGLNLSASIDITAGGTITGGNIHSNTAMSATSMTATADISTANLTATGTSTLATTSTTDLSVSGAFNAINVAATNMTLTGLITAPNADINTMKLVTLNNKPAP